MIISLEKKPKKYKVDIGLEEESVKGKGQGKAEIELLHNNFNFELPFEIKDPHPDLITLAVLTVVLPWVDNKISLSYKVSPEFAAAVTDVFGFQVDGIDKGLQPRKKGSRDGLAFSGGVDSIAAALVLPEDTIKLTFIRQQHAEVPDRQSGRSIPGSEKILKYFDNTYAVYSDLEHITGPRPQFPTWVALSVPCFLLADHFHLKSISYGTVLGSAYFASGKYRATDIPNCPDWQWRPLFAAAGIDLIKPVAGLTEAGTSIITNNSKFKDTAVSCQLGASGEPCMKCLKCFRKYCIRIAINEEAPSALILNNFWQQKGIRNYMAGTVPLPVQHIFMFAFSRIKRSDLSYPFRLFRDKLLLSGHFIEWNTRYYPLALQDYVPDPGLRETVKKNIEKYISPMNSEDIETVRTWDLDAHYANNKDKENDIDKAIIFCSEKQEEVELLKRSLRYRIGYVLVKSLVSPRQAIRLPWRLYKLYKERKDKSVLPSIRIP